MSEHVHKWHDEQTRTIQGYWYVWQRCEECHALQVVTDAPKQSVRQDEDQVNTYGY
jgi:hypothetical protein